MTLFNKKEQIDNKYEVQFPIHQTTYGESYRVKGLDDGKLYMLKIYYKDRLLDHHFTEDGTLIEAYIHQQIDHPNIVKYVDHQILSHNGKELIYYVVNFVSGETLQERMDREGAPSPEIAFSFFIKLLSAVNYLHNMEIPVIHADITPLNIMLDLSNNNFEPILFDFGLARHKESDYNAFNRSLPSVFYCAPELLKGKATIASDIFSMGALFYTLLTGSFPWNGQITNSQINSESFADDLLSSRNKKLAFNSSNKIDDQYKLSIIQSLLPEADTRFKDIETFSKSISKELEISKKEIKTQERLQVLKKKPGDGFKKVAGMEALKKMIQEDVIDPLLSPEKFKDYGIDPPNGILFYGPPGCGKTFFAECLAEEVGFSFFKVGPSDVGSQYVHGGQEKIKQLFEAAIENAPTILFLDEIDAMIPNRDGSMGHHYESEVNEWLVQINNSAKHDVFIIGATNRLAKMDTAVLRSGRFDRKIHIPLPDDQSRESLFELELEKRKNVLADDIDNKELAKKAIGFTCSDISMIVMDSARAAQKLSSKITMEMILEVINNTNPSVNEKEVKDYNKEKKSEDVKSIGFQIPAKAKEKHKDDTIAELEAKKNEAVKNEDYAKAAELKKRIDKLKEK